MAIVEASSYLSECPAPATPHDLAGHCGINRRLPTPGTVNVWRLVHDDSEIRVRVDGPLIFNTIELMLDAALVRRKMAYLPLDQVEIHLRDGQLVRVLAEWTPPLPDITCTTPVAARPHRLPLAAERGALTSVFRRQPNVWN
ncbi:LysR substrate-binding domain-containing protein [Bosea thiooxidans]